MAKSVWDKFADLFKTESQKAQERQEGINKALKDEKSILDDLAALDKQYRDSLPKEEEIDIEALFPSDSGLKEIEYVAETDEDIAKRAQFENERKKQLDSDRLNDKYEAQKSAYGDKKEDAKQTLKESYEKLGAVYDDLRRRTENDVLKRGLARSSVATSQLGDLDRSHMEGASKLQTAYTNAIADIDGRIAGLEADRVNALDELDIKYALELDERIAELKAERDKTVLKYEQYNQSVRQQNEDYAKRRQADINEYLADVQKQKEDEQKRTYAHEKMYGYEGEKQENYAKRYEIASAFYSSLDPEIAYDALAASPNMKYYLGHYYGKLLNSLKSTKVDEYEPQKRYY